MRILEPAFGILKISGCWKLSPSTPVWKKIMYNVYTFFLLLVLTTFAASQILDMLLNVKTADEFSDSFYIFVTAMLAWCKLITLLVNHRYIESAIENLRDDPCNPVNAEEDEIGTAFDKSIGNTTLQYLILVEVTVFSMIASSLYTDFRHRRLSYRVWLPYDCSSSYLYYFTYIHHTIALIANSLMNVSCDSTINGLMVHTCGQFAILEHRLKKITPESCKDLIKCIRHHEYLYRFAYTLNRKFKIAIGLQFLSSTLVICFNLYELTNTPFSSKYLEFVLYMACMMAQILFYCWYGHQLKLKSIDIIYAVYEMDWVILDNKTKKNLLLIMRRAMNPIQCTSAYVIPMDLNAFVGILKLSYSTYNLLQRTKEKS